MGLKNSPSFSLPFHLPLSFCRLVCHVRMACECSESKRRSCKGVWDRLEKGMHESIEGERQSR